MKRIILSLLLICSFFTLASFPVFSQGLVSSCNFPPQCQEVPLCTDTVDCFKFDLYEPKPKVGDPTKTVIKIMVTNYSESTLTNVAFELPNGVTASAPLNNTVFRNRYNHDVTNPFNPAAWVPGMGPSIMYKNRLNTGGTFSFGGFEVYYFEVNTSDLIADRLMTVAARAGRPYQPLRIGSTSFNFDTCGVPCPPPVSLECLKEDCCFNYSFGARTQLDDQTGTPEANISFPLFNICGATVTEVNFSLPAGLTAQDFANMDEFASNINETFVANKSNPLFLRFIATPGDPAWDGSEPFNEDEQFAYDLPAALVRQPGNNLVTVTIKTTSGDYSQTFNIINEECGITPLPVRMISFDGKTTREGVALNWKTATEKDNDRFEIQRSSDGLNYERIGSVKGNGSSTIQREYGFTDKQPLAGLNYYRLNQVDFDGTSAYSKVIKVNSGELAKEHTVQLTPNPCRGDNCTIQLTGFSGNNPISIELRDITGRLVFSKTLTADQTSVVLPNLNTDSGIYILSAQDGTNVAIRKVILQ